MEDLLIMTAQVTFQISSSLILPSCSWWWLWWWLKRFFFIIHDGHKIGWCTPSEWVVGYGENETELTKIVPVFSVFASRNRLLCSFNRANRVRQGRWHRSGGVFRQACLLFIVVDLQFGCPIWQSATQSWNANITVGEPKLIKTMSYFSACTP